MAEPWSWPRPQPNVMAFFIILNTYVMNKKVRLRERPKAVLLSNWGTSLYLFLINSHFWENGKKLAQHTFTTMEVNAKIGPWGYFFLPALVCPYFWSFCKSAWQNPFDYYKLLLKYFSKYDLEILSAKSL